VLSQKVLLCHVSVVTVTDVAEGCSALILRVNSASHFFDYWTLKIDPFQPPRKTHSYAQHMPNSGEIYVIEMCVHVCLCVCVCVCMLCVRACMCACVHVVCVHVCVCVRACMHAHA